MLLAGLAGGWTGHTNLIFMPPCARPRAWRRIARIAAAPAFAAVAASLAPRAADAQSSIAGQTIVGEWTTISDDDGKPMGIVQIQLDSATQTYVGFVRGILADAGPADSVCGRCGGALENQRIVGMEILRGMRRDGDEYTGGEILDPETGKTYRARLRLIDGGAKLEVRGYIGVPLFGRSQVWIRRR